MYPAHLTPRVAKFFGNHSINSERFIPILIKVMYTLL